MNAQLSIRHCCLLNFNDWLLFVHKMIERSDYWRCRWATHWFRSSREQRVWIFSSSSLISSGEWRYRRSYWTSLRGSRPFHLCQTTRHKDDERNTYINLGMDQDDIYLRIVSSRSVSDFDERMHRTMRRQLPPPPPPLPASSHPTRNNTRVLNDSMKPK